MMTEIMWTVMAAVAFALLNLGLSARQITPERVFAQDNVETESECRIFFGEGGKGD